MLVDPLPEETRKREVELRVYIILLTSALVLRHGGRRREVLKRG